MESLRGRCFRRLSLGNARIQDGTSQPESAITLAMFRRNGLSSSVYNVIASPLRPALPDRPVGRQDNNSLITKKINHEGNKNGDLTICFLMLSPSMKIKPAISRL